MLSVNWRANDSSKTVPRNTQSLIVTHERQVTQHRLETSVFPPIYQLSKEYPIIEAETSMN